MYDRPEVAHANDSLWTLIRDNLGYGPTSLTRNMPFWDIWRSPDMVFSQTCGLPYRSELHNSVQLVGTPDYGALGCPPGYYRSAIVARRVSGIDLANLSDTRFAYNERLSQSGWAAFWDHQDGNAPPAELIETGGHVVSAEAVASGRAEIASIDMHTWNLISKFDDFADRLEVIALTRPTPGLPFITARANDASAIQSAVRAAIDAMDQDLKDVLQIRSLVSIPPSEYLAIAMPPRSVI